MADTCGMSPACSDPTVYELARAFPEVADILHRQLCELSTSPTQESAEDLAVNLDGALEAMLRLQAALIREGAGYG